MSDAGRPPRIMPRIVLRTRQAAEWPEAKQPETPGEAKRVLMYNSIFLAQILGILFFVFGVEMLVNGKFVTAVVEESIQNRGLLWVMGFIALLLGAIMVLAEEVWVGWPIVVTIIGWLTFIKGVLITLFPNSMAKWYRAWNRPGLMVWGGAVATLLGIFLIYAGFVL